MHSGHRLQDWGEKEGGVRYFSSFPKTAATSKHSIFLMAEIASVTTHEKSLCVLQFPFMVTLPLLHALFSHYLALFLTFLLSEQHHGSIPNHPRSVDCSSRADAPCRSGQLADCPAPDCGRGCPCTALTCRFALPRLFSLTPE